MQTTEDGVVIETQADGTVVSFFPDQTTEVRRPDGTIVRTLVDGTQSVTRPGVCAVW